MKPRAKPNVFIVGFMASGKTKLGKSLAARLGWRFIDTDAEIEKKAGLKISQIFSRYGEARFRHLESQALRKVAKLRKHVISVGGGAVLKAHNLKLMREHGAVLYRSMPFGLLFERGERRAKTQKRPLWKGETVAQRHKAMLSLFYKRQPQYKRAAHLELKKGANNIRQATAHALKTLMNGSWIKK